MCITKAPVIGASRMFYSFMMLTCLACLLSNTKLTKNIIQLILISDLSGDLAEVV